MKTAISLPDELFNAVERIVRRTKRHRSEVYADALREYVARHDPDEITETINRVVPHLEETPEEREFRYAAARELFKASEW
jgi:metal-responsive CopG/Arc/MetJ family transcriptional regulator